MSVCPLCNGTGERLYIHTDSRTKHKRLVSQYCLCRKAEFVSDHYKFLGFLGGFYLPFEKIDKKLVFTPGDLPSSPNLLIRNTGYNTFCLQMKSIIMKYRFADPPKTIYCSKSIDVLHNFYVQQEDGSSPHLSSTDKFDLMIITLDTLERNSALSSVISEVVQMRRHRKPTWLYQTKPTLEACTQEYSEELEAMINDEQYGYKKVSLDTIRFDLNDKITESQDDSANFRPNGGES